MALLENNYGFVNALLEKGINLESFLTLERFEKLYNSRKVLTVISYHEWTIKLID
jgi:hypothetical protein